MELADARAGLRDKAQRRSADLLQHIRDRVADGTWSGGDRLPTERELVAQFGIARNTLRKVMDQLERDGVITRHVGRGTFVTPKPVVTPPEGQLLQRIHGASPAEIMELRLLIEPQFVALATVRATVRDLQHIENCLRQNERAVKVPEFEHWDGMLHQAILSAAHNNLLNDLYEAINSVRRQPEWESLKKRSLTPARLARYKAQHRAIVAALRLRDAEAASRAIRQHLSDVSTAMMDAL